MKQSPDNLAIPTMENL